MRLHLFRNPTHFLARHLPLSRPGGAVIFLLAALSGWAAPDQSAGFDTSAEGWRATDAAAMLSWEGAGGTPGGYLRGARSGSTNAWYLVSPSAWAGDWSGYRVLKFDLSIPSRHYPDAERAGLVVLVGTNGQEMTWMASTPLWTWTHYEVDLSPAAFGVDQATFDGILANVAELRILAEFTTASEAVGVDNVLVTAALPEVHPDLVSRFTDGTIQGWRPVDDVTLSASETGWPSFGLMANDWRDGRFYRIATPVAWAGDWRAYRRLSFDLRWSGANTTGPVVELVRIFGANGQSLAWSGPLTNDLWVHYSLALEPESFGVTAEQFQGVMAHVSEMWIRGEFGDADDITYLDNVLLTTDTDGPPVLSHNLVSRFDANDEGWQVYDNGTRTWFETGGVSGGGLRCVDGGIGTVRFQTPDAWIGDWRAFRTLGFYVKPGSGSLSDFAMAVWIVASDGRTLQLDLPRVPGSWTPFTVDLVPETFGVSAEEFEAVMGDVACAWIRADIGDGLDTAWLDNVVLLTETGTGLPPERWCDFESGVQEWRKGAWNTGTETWTFAGATTHTTSGGNPGGFVANTDEYDWTYWFSPSGWAGDWRGYASVSFDFNILQGTAANLFGSRMLSIISAHTNLNIELATLPVPGRWEHYEFSLTPDTFGVTAEQFDQVMRDVVALAIRSEWITGSEREGLDNVRLTKASDAYWTWIADFFNSADLADERIAGRQADPDADGKDNWSEFVAGTIPTNRLDVLRIERLALTDSLGALEFHSKPGRLYGVDCAPELSLTNNWVTLTNDIPGTGLLLTVPVAPGEAQQFYRLTVRPN